MNYSTKKQKMVSAKVLAIILAVVLVFPVGNIFSWGNNQSTAVYAAEAEKPTISFQNLGEGDDTISMTDERSFSATLDTKGQLSVNQLKELLDNNKINWTLTRSSGLQDETMFPYQYLGGKLGDWKTVKTEFKDSQNFFNNIKMTQNGTKLNLSFSNVTMFGCQGVGADNCKDYELISNSLLDYTGAYDLKCKDKNGSILGKTTVQVRPYDSFRTQEEINDELEKAAVTAKKNGIYAEVNTFGTTALGNDMKAIFIADNKKTLTDYQLLKEKAETNPDALIGQIKSGSLDYKVPILYSNVHSDETPGSDANMNFIWDMVNSKDGKITYSVITGFTTDGAVRLEKEKKLRHVAWSKLIKDDATGVGFIRGKDDTSNNQYAITDTQIKDMAKYYTMKDITVDVKQLLDDVFFIVVPAENVDAKLMNVRHNGNGFDLNRDNTFQTQPETKAMTSLIANWNPISFIELHGYISGFQIEPCSPTHEPNIEYDLFAANGIAAGEAFGNAAVSNNSKYNSFVMPLRDYLVDNGDGTTTWAEPWDDMSTSYTPQYALLHGAIAYTIECPVGDEETTKALEYGLINQAKYVGDNKDSLFINQLTGFSRGLNNVDADSVRDWYVDVNDNIGAEADIFRERYKENGKFFPEYYVIPVDIASQEDTQSAYEMADWLMRNGVILKELTKDVTLDGVTYKEGSFVVDMHQAKRNVANTALYTDVLIEHWTDLYSEPLTAFAQLRGFDYSVITKTAAFSRSEMKNVTEPPKGKTIVTGNEGELVIVSNNSVDAVNAINKLLKTGRSVGYITEGKNKGDFVAFYDDFGEVKDDYVLIAERTKTLPTAKTINESAKLYIPGHTDEFMVDGNGKPFGARNYDNSGNYRYHWDLFAYGQQLGFDIVATPDKADVIVGNQEIDKDALAEVKAGTPYIAYSTRTLDTIKNLGIGFDWQSGYHNMEDALTTVTYENSSMVTDKYVMENDNIMYGYGGARITKVPTEAKVLIKTTSDKPMEGFMIAENVKKYKESVQAIEYKSGNLDLTVFANSMTNKAHQQDDYRYVTNAIYSKMLGSDFTMVRNVAGFKDVKSDAWYADSVKYVVSNKLFNGIGKTVFAPEDKTTRGMFVTIFGNINGTDDKTYKNMFTDVKAGKWYEKSVSWATGNNIVKGYSATEFGPENKVTREEMCVLMVNYAKFAKVDLKAKKEMVAFDDSDSINAWAKDAVVICQKAGLVNGKDENKFDPQGFATRAETATIMSNFFSLTK